MTEHPSFELHMPTLILLCSCLLLCTGCDRNAWRCGYELRRHRSCDMSWAVTTAADGIGDTIWGNRYITVAGTLCAMVVDVSSQTLLKPFWRCVPGNASLTKLRPSRSKTCMFLNMQRDRDKQHALGTDGVRRTWMAVPGCFRCTRYQSACAEHWSKDLDRTT